MAAATESPGLTPDQVALLELMAVHRLDYDALAGVLGVPSRQVRARGRDAILALAPDTAAAVAPRWRGRLADRALRQQNAGQAAVTRLHLARSAAARRWVAELRRVLDSGPAPAPARRRLRPPPGMSNGGAPHDVPPPEDGPEDGERAEPRLSAKEVRGRAAAGVALLAVRGVSIRIVGMASNLLLARLLVPRDFGLVATGTAIVMFGDYLANSGLGSALIRHRRPPGRSMLRAVVGLQVSVTVAFAAVVGAVGILLAGTSGRIAAVMVLGLPIVTLRTPSIVLLERSLAYRVLALVDVTDALVYAAWSIATVAAGWGVWGLATAGIARAVGGTALIARLGPCGIVPPGGSWRQLRSIAGFAARFQSIGMLNLVRDQGLNLGTAAIAGLTTLGLWTLVYRVLQTVLLVYEGMWRVSYPAMSQLMAAGEDVRPILERGIRVVAAASALFLAPVAACGAALFPSLLGARWGPAASILPGMCLGLVIGGPVSVSLAGFLFACGDSGTPLRGTALHTAAQFAVGFSLLPVLGPVALGLAALTASMVDAAVIARAARRRAGVRSLPELAPAVLAAVAAATPGWLLTHAYPPTIGLALGAAALTVAVYLALLAVVARPLLVDLWSLVLSAAHRRRPVARGELLAATS